MEINFNDGDVKKA